MTMGSAQMGIFSFESNGVYTSVYSQKPFSPNGFLNCWRPTCRVALWSKNPSKKKWRFALRVVNSGGGILEKEFEFKPSFDEYLKTMESVREKKQSFKSNRGNSSEKLNKGKSKDDSKRNVGEEEKISKIVKHNEIKMKSKGATRTRSKKALLVKSEDGDLNAERDEYKNFEESNDVVHKPQVSRMEMEERIRKVAKLYVLYALFFSSAILFILFNILFVFCAPITTLFI